MAEPTETATLSPSRRIEHDLREQMRAGRLRDGDRLPAEAALSAHYGVARNTTREALRALESQGLLQVKRGAAGGAFVRVPSSSHVTSSLETAFALLAGHDHVTVYDLVQVRQMLEVPAAELAALHRSDDDLAALRRHLYEPQRLDPAHVFPETSGFHIAMLKASGNPLLELVAGPVFQVLHERFLRELAPTQVWLDVDRDHREIVGYIEAGDPVGAREATRAHLWASRRYYEGMELTEPTPDGS